MDKPQPPRSFETQRTLLRPIERDDAEAIFLGYSGSPTATRFINFRRHQSRAEAAQFAERCVRCWKDQSAYPWAVISKGANEFMGVVELSVDPPQADFGYIFGDRFWAKASVRRRRSQSSVGHMRSARFFECGRRVIPTTLAPFACWKRWGWLLRCGLRTGRLVRSLGRRRAPA